MKLFVFSIAGALLTGSIVLRAQTVEWLQQTPANSPSERFSSGMAFDDRTRVTVLFGGANNAGEKFSDTWIWHNGWFQLGPKTIPPARQGPGMVWDGSAQNLVMFGGIAENGDALADTWIWNGENWIEQFPPVSPPGRLLDGEGMTYDAATHTVVLFGGASPNGALNDTWTWDGIAKTWTQRFPSDSPAPRRTTIAYDYAAQNVVLFGGDNGNLHYGDTWIWNGVNWTEQSPSTAPSARTMGSFHWDPQLERVVLFGGVGQAPMNDTWYWRDGAWTEAFPTGNLPSVRWAAPIDFDPASHGLLMFGGDGYRGDTWLFSVVTDSAQ